MTITMKATAKVAAVATGLAMATSMLALAPVAHAALTQNQVDQIVGLLEAFGADAATVANVRTSLMGGTPSTPGTGMICSIGTTDLTIGSSGPSVTGLQTALIANGYSIPAGATGYFGTQTQAAVAAWQRAMNISPPAGYFGPISRAAFNLCAPGTPGTPGTPTTPTAPTTGLSGTDGSIQDFTELGSFNNEEVAEGQNSVKILGADLEVSNDGDIALKSVKVSFDPTGNTGSDNLDDYLDEVSIMLGSDVIGSADVDEFSEDSAGLWTKTITVTNATIEAEDVVKLYVTVDAANTIDSADISGDSWTVDIENIRFIDGSGVTTTDNSTGDINALNQAFDFVSFATAANTELKISTASDNPEAGIVVIDDTSNTDDVSLLKGRLKLDGTSDVVLDEFPVTLTTVGGADLVSVTGSVTLKIGGNTFSESVTSTALTATVTFDNLNFTIDAGETVNFEVLADINDIDAGNLDEGDTLLASVTSTNRDFMDVENEDNTQLADSNEKSGTATGEAQEFRTNGIALTLVSTSALSNDNDVADTGTFKIKFKVTAIGDAVYVTSLTSGATFTTDRSGTATTADNITSAFVNTTDTTLTSVGNSLIEDGSSETFEMTVIIPNGAGGTTGLFRTVLTGVLWDTSDDTSPANTYSSNLDTFRTDYVLLDNA